jgi:hypothetical protein
MFDPIYVRPNQYRSRPFVGEIPVSQGDVPRATPDVAGEMARRASDVQALARMRVDVAEGIKDLQDFAKRNLSEYESFKASFFEKYGSINLTSRPADLFSGDDEIALSDEAKAYLADLNSLEKKRKSAEESAKGAENYEARRRRSLAAYEAMTEMAAAGWDLWYAPSDGEKIAAWNKFTDAGNRMAKNGAEKDYEFAVRDVRNAAVKAGASALTEGLQGPALFKVADNGRIDFSVEGLGHLSPDAQAAAQLKRLVEIMSVRNGLSPLQGAVKKALDIQNAYIAAHPVVAGIVELPF